MKKFFILFPALVVVLLVALPMSCSNDDDDNNSGEGVKTVLDTKGYIKYGELVKDSANVKIVKGDDGLISLTLKTTVPGLNVAFRDVNVNMSNDTSFLKAQDFTEGGSGTDDDIIRILAGRLVSGNELFFSITGSDFNDTLFFATSKDKLMPKDVDACQPDVPNKALVDLLNCSWQGSASYDGTDAVDVTFSSVLDENGYFSIDLGACKFSENAPVMNIELNDMCSFAGAADSNLTFNGNSAFYDMGGMSGNMPAAVRGEYTNGQLHFSVDITVGRTSHTIEISNATIK